MKKIILVTFLLSSSVFAQMPPGFNAQSMKNMEKNMQAMMAGMANIEQCMSHVDQSKIDVLEAKAGQLETDIHRLCQQGNSAEAKNKAIQFSKEISTHSELLKMKKCMAPMGAMAESMTFDKMYKDIESDSGDICAK